MRKLLAIPCALALLAGGCGSSSGTGTTTRRSGPNLDKGAARFAVQHEAELANRKFAKAWRSLHPAQQRVVSARRIASCYPRYAYPGPVTFRAKTVADVRWTVPGTGETTDAKAVTLTAKVGKKSTSFADHIVRVDGEWKWSLSEAAFRLAKAGKC